jgi:ethanolamine ammonia-lyase small subunit
MGNIDFLKKLTEARIALGHTGVSIPTRQSLEFKLAHAHARDAVYSSMNICDLREQLKAFGLDVLELHSRAKDRGQYLQRPDLGKKLDDASAKLLSDQLTGYDICICIADGLSAFAIEENSMRLVDALLPKLLGSDFTVAPICLITQGRVAIADDIGLALRARLTIILIGERPGLSAADSMGVYLTYQPRPGLTDDSRNCVSNIRKAGLTTQKAADKIYYLIIESFRKKLSGILLKDNEGTKNLPPENNSGT